MLRRLARGIRGEARRGCSVVSPTAPREGRRKSPFASRLGLVYNPSPPLGSPADVAQLARASACHAEGRGFESLHPLHDLCFFWPKTGPLGPGFLE